MEKQSFLLNILVYGITTIFLPLSFIIIQDHFLKQIDDFRMIIGNISNQILVFIIFKENITGCRRIL